MFLKVFIFILVQGFCQSLDFLRLSNEHHNICLDQYLRNRTEHTFEQKIDHFNESDHRSFKMRYGKATEYWKPGGPIFLYIGGEFPIQTNNILTAEEGCGQNVGIVIELIQETNAALYILEHRYYGESKPFANPTVDDLKYLSVKQALADVAHVLQTFKATEEYKNSKVLVIGGSYSGNLAAWMKVVYPELVDAAHCSSGPLLAKKDFYEYFEGVKETFKTYGSQDCVDEITTKFNSIQELLQTPEGIKKLKRDFNICNKTDMTVPENQQVFFSFLTYNYGGNAQYGTSQSIKDMCQNITLHWPRSLVMDDELHVRCFDLDFNTIIPKVYKERSWLWFYQTCTEFGYYQTTTSNNQMFGQDTVPLEYYLKTCKLLFGEEFDERRVDEGVMNTNKKYGGLTPNVENVVFVNGDMDPWHRLGVLHDLSAAAPAVYVMGVSHCSDLSLRPDDADDVNEAYDKIKYYIKKWIGAST